MPRDVTVITMVDEKYLRYLQEAGRSLIEQKSLDEWLIVAKKSLRSELDAELERLPDSVRSRTKLITDHSLLQNPAHARHIGLTHAQEDSVIFFLDADDKMAPANPVLGQLGGLDRARIALRQFNVGAFWGRSARFNNQEQPLPEPPNRWHGRTLTRLKVARLLGMTSDPLPYNAAVLMVRKLHLLRAGITPGKFGEDLTVIFCLAANGIRIKLQDPDEAPVHLYRIHPGSQSESVNEDQSIGLALAYDYGRQAALASSPLLRWMRDAKQRTTSSRREGRSLRHK